MDLSEYLQKYTNIEPFLVGQVNEIFQEKSLPKGTILLEEGKKSSKVYYIKSGMIRSFYYKDGKEITHFFFSEKMFQMALNNITREGTYPYTLELLEDSVLQEGDFNQIESLSKQFPSLHKLIQYLLADMIQRLNQKIYGLQFHTAQERYEFLLQQHRNILQRVPLGYIASYLGITQQRLSVIRGAK